MIDLGMNIYVDHVVANGFFTGVRLIGGLFQSCRTALMPGVPEIPAERTAVNQDSQSAFAASTAFSGAA